VEDPEHHQQREPLQRREIGYHKRRVSAVGLWLG
jgi:hypothetical protein